uniref:C2H2-type domain-containing protein n=2 Tax=Kalanchoe fedtschenkoi TaxID=63787 RepID=A0A7N0TFQ7_KALFE
MATISDAPSTQKKKRTQPDPDAEVIALSPKTLMATNRFICEVCNKGFQREQNLQLHRRGHSLPWKLKQKSSKEVARKKVYLCPEPSCVHHDPARALGDLTGIKKHFSRKHGEKKWKCDKCSKKYAVQSDWKAHSKTCGTKEYRCDCGTLFSRRDSFMTHRAFCEALAQENAMNPTNLSAITSQLFGHSLVAANQISPHHQELNFHKHSMQHSDNLPAARSNGDGFRPFGSLLPPLNGSAFRPISTDIVFGSSSYHQDDQDHHSPNKVFMTGMMQQLPQDQIPSDQTDHSFFSNIASKNDSENPTNNDSISISHLSSSNLFANRFSTSGGIGGSFNSAQGPTSGLFSGNTIMGDQISPSLYSSAVSLQNSNNASASAHLSATALLQKAAQVGSSCSINGSSALLRSLGSSLSGPSSKLDLQASPRAIDFKALLGDKDDKNLHEMISSLGGGGSTTTSSMFGSLAKGLTGYNDEHQENSNSLCSTKLSFGKLLEEEYSKEQPQNVFNDTLTRDFLGVGQIVRQLSGGFSQYDMMQLQQGHQVSSKTSIREGREFGRD